MRAALASPTPHMVEEISHLPYLGHLSPLPRSGGRVDVGDTETSRGTDSHLCLQPGVSPAQPVAKCSPFMLMEVKWVPVKDK